MPCVLLTHMPVRAAPQQPHACMHLVASSQAPMQGAEVPVPMHASNWIPTRLVGLCHEQGPNRKFKRPSSRDT